MPKEYTRRNFLRKAVAGVAASSVLMACQPKVVEVEKIVKETVEVEKQVEVEKIVKETVVVEGATPAPKEPITLRFHARIGEQENKLYEMQMPKFMEANPHITLELENFPGAEYITKVTTMHAGGTLGDVVWGAIGQAIIHFFYSSQLVRPIDELVAADGFDLSEYYEGCIKALTLEGKVLGLPFKAHPGLAIYYYNEDLFEQAGVPLPVPEWTHDDMVEAALAIQGIAGDQPIFGVLPSTAWKGILTLIRSFGGELISEDGNTLLLNSDEGMAAIQLLYDLFQTHKVAPPPEQMIGDANQMWASGYLGMYQGGTSVSVMKNTIGDKFKWMAVNNPIGPAGVGGSDYEVDCYSVTAATPNPTEAFEWVKYLCNQDSGVLLGVIGGTVGGRPDVYGSPVLLSDPVRPVFRDIMDNAQDSRVVGNWRQDECEKAVVQLLQPLWAGQEQPTKAFVDSVTAQIQDIMNMPRP
ncbi:MAG TPA: sugar ABC transporter substrate-binding protein [Chloroflexi bacterium]|jgi:ABC-type glycerol-3-phosphate transport system substrate-binding protein|nr:sugar ABC transporter substrate-binding protein [Chloroflexota bacterium]